LQFNCGKIIATAEFFGLGEHRICDHGRTFVISQMRATLPICGFHQRNHFAFMLKVRICDQSFEFAVTPDSAKSATTTQLNMCRNTLETSGFHPDHPDKS
ncbi:hypothetical protein HAX54_015475, partial [Datura stramonium]|nr:hypothetical protein [Datura stramonium]